MLKSARALNFVSVKPSLDGFNSEHPGRMPVRSSSQIGESSTLQGHLNRTPSLMSPCIDLNTFDGVEWLIACNEPNERQTAVALAPTFYPAHVRIIVKIGIISADRKLSSSSPMLAMSTSSL